MRRSLKIVSVGKLYPPVNAPRLPCYGCKWVTGATAKPQMMSGKSKTAQLQCSAVCRALAVVVVATTQSYSA